MKTKIMTGIIATTMLMVSAVSADAATRKQAIEKIVNKTTDAVGKACDNVSQVIWRNKCAVAVGATAVAVATNPEPFVQGATAVVTSTTQAAMQSSTGGGFFSFLLLATLFIAGLWLFVGCIRSKFWRVVPLLVVALLLCFGGIAEAGMIASIPDIQCPAVPPPAPWWNIINFIFLIIAIFV